MENQTGTYPLTPVVVIVDDREDTLKTIAGSVQRRGLTPIARTTVEEALAAIDDVLVQKDQRLVAVVSDLKITGDADDGWGVLSYAFEKSKTARLCILSGLIEGPVQALFRSGAAIPAFTIFEKTGAGYEEFETWLMGIRDSWRSSLSVSLRDLETKRVYEVVAPIYARSKLPILILGESGTGKESLARHVHQTSLQKGPIISINCGGMEPSLAFSELFGHTANAFTDASFNEVGLVLRASGYKTGQRQLKTGQSYEDWLREANRDLIVDGHGFLSSAEARDAAGTLFLDEVAALPRKVMAGLLRVLSTADVLPLGHHGAGIRSYCRIVAATNETNILESAWREPQDDLNAFRRDLCYRLGGAILTLRPLRERDPDDIRHYVKDVVWTQLEDVESMAVEETAVLQIIELYQSRSDVSARQYQLGNFRALKNLTYRAALIARGEGSGVVTRLHVEAAEKHGRLLVGETEALGDGNHIREVFLRRVREFGFHLEDDFSWDKLKELTKLHPVKVACAFLDCSLATRSGLRRGYYESSEIQLALTGGLALNAWLLKSLSRDHIRDAAIEYFMVDPMAMSPEAKVRLIIEKTRETAHVTR